MPDCFATLNPKNLQIFCLCILVFFASDLQSLGQSKTPVDVYKLVWADEFNTAGAPDSASWNFEKGFQRNHELQWYQEQNARCQNGYLTIKAQRVHLPNPAYSAGSSDWKTKDSLITYTSSSLNSSGLHSWQYGRFVMRAKIPTEKGLWPAFWTLGVSGQWPSNGEIDIMEFYKNKLLANIACGTGTAYKALWYSKTKDLATFKDKKWKDRFHIWRMDWDAEAISLFVDDELLNRVPLKDLVNRDGSNINPFKQPHYILLNLAVGGDNGGDPALTSFPKEYMIDYVRVYQKKENNQLGSTDSGKR
ncbi:beta-glucanase [Mucilaginibacter sp. PAMC 26640]|nr:beta-glucanase [Mucilaginibacter sp. PAMC 26640]